MEKKLMLIANPNAGKGRARMALGDIIEVFSGAGYLPTVYLTAGRGDATGFAQEKAGNYDLCVCCGGDGTLSEVTAGLARCTAAPPLGYIPMGTANDVASTLGLSKKARQAAQSIVAGRTVPYDLGCFNDEHFTYVAAFGAFTSVSYETSQALKARLGHLAYVLEGLRYLPKIQPVPVRVEYDGGCLEEPLIFGGVTNATSMAGMLHFPQKEVCLGDGQFELMLIRPPKDPIQLAHIVDNILRQRYDPDYVCFTHCSRALFTFPSPVAWTRDGEAGGSYDRVEIKNQTGAIQFVIPEDSQCK